MTEISLWADEKRCRAGPPRIFAVGEPASGLPPNQPHPLGLLNFKNTGTDLIPPLYRLDDVKIVTS